MRSESSGGERIASQIRRHQLRKAAHTLGLDPEFLIERVAMLAEAFPKAFEELLEGLTGSAPGAGEVAERTVLALKTPGASWIGLAAELKYER